jgi:hypothetical protein
MLLGMHAAIWATPPALFALIVFKTVSPFLPSLAWTTTLPFYASHNTGVTSACHHAFLTNVLVWLAWNRYPPNLGLLCSLG